MSISERRLDWAVMQALSELDRQNQFAHLSPYSTLDLPALVRVVMEAGDSGVSDTVSSMRVLGVDFGSQPSKTGYYRG